MTKLIYLCSESGWVSVNLRFVAGGVSKPSGGQMWSTVFRMAGDASCSICSLCNIAVSCKMEKSENLINSMFKLILELLMLCCRVLTNISILVVCIWMMCESSATRFGQTCPRPCFVCTCSLLSKRHNFGVSKQMRKNGSIHTWHGFIVIQSRPDNFIAVFLR